MPDPRSETRTVGFSPGDLSAALADFGLIRAGLMPTELGDPVATICAENDVTLLDILCRINYEPAGQPKHLVVQRALHTGDAAAAFDVMVGRTLAIGYQRAAAPYRPLMFDLPTAGFKPGEVALVDLGDVGAVTGAIPEQPVISVETGAMTAPTLYTAKFRVSREVIIGDDIGFVASLTSQAGAMGARLEAKALAALIEANPALPDGDNLIVSANTTSATGLDSTSLAEAAGKMLTAATPAGNVAAVRPSFLLTPAATSGRPAWHFAPP